MTHADKKRRLWDWYFDDDESSVAEFRLSSTFPVDSYPSIIAVDGDPLVLGVEFRATQPGCVLTHLHFWQPGGGFPDAVERTAALFDAASGVQVGATATLPATTVEVPPGLWSSSPRIEIPLEVNKRYVAAVLCLNKQFGLKANYFGADDVAIGGGVLLSGTAGATGNDQGSYDFSGVLVCPRSSANSANYFVDVTIEKTG